MVLTFDCSGNLSLKTNVGLSLLLPQNTPTIQGPFPPFEGLSKQYFWTKLGEAWIWKFWVSSPIPVWLKFTIGAVSTLFKEPLNQDDKIVFSL